MYIYIYIYIYIYYIMYFTLIYIYGRTMQNVDILISTVAYFTFLEGITGTRLRNLPNLRLF